MRNVLFCIITVIASEGGPEKGCLEFVHLGILALMFVRLVYNIYPGVDSYIAMLGMTRVDSYSFLETIRSGSIVQKNDHLVDVK